MITGTNDEYSKVEIEEVKAQWKLLWQERIDDRVRAEGVADRSFSLLAVERGTVIMATRDFKALNLKDILSSYNVSNVDRVVGPHPSEGGWTKFARTVLNKQSRIQKFNAEVILDHKERNGQLKKGGRGWLHK